METCSPGSSVTDDVYVALYQLRDRQPEAEAMDLSQSLSQHLSRSLSVADSEETETPCGNVVGQVQDDKLSMKAIVSLE